MFRVLVVDDDENVNMFISRLLAKKFSCTVDSAKNGLEALSKLKEFLPDVLFLDVTMPVMNGIETLESIRADEDFFDISVIMLTAVGEKQTVAKVFDLGVVDYMLKPLMYDSAYERIKELFEIVKKEKFRREARLKNIENVSNSDSSVMKFLIVDSDAEFRKNLRKHMEKIYKVFEAETGAEGLKIFMHERPQVVCLGENLSLLNEKIFAQKIQSFRSKQELTIYALKAKAHLDEEEKKLYDHVLKKRADGKMF